MLLYRRKLGYRSRTMFYKAAEFTNWTVTMSAVIKFFMKCTALTSSSRWKEENGECWNWQCRPRLIREPSPACCWPSSASSWLLPIEPVNCCYWSWQLVACCWCKLSMKTLYMKHLRSSLELEGTQSSNPRCIAINPNPNRDLWPFNHKPYTTCRISQGHSLYQCAK